MAEHLHAKVKPSVVERELVDEETFDLWITDLCERGELHHALLSHLDTWKEIHDAGLLETMLQLLRSDAASTKSHCMFSRRQWLQLQHTASTP